MARPLFPPINLETSAKKIIIPILKLSFLPNKIGSKTNLTHNIVRYNIAKLDEITTSWLIKLITIW